jgi:hypothetical protein
MAWKKDEKGALVLNEAGNPVFVQEDNQEYAVDYEAMRKKQQEASRGEERFRKEAQELKARYEALKDVPDVKAYAEEHLKLQEDNARLLENTDVKKIEELVQAGKLQVEKAFQDKLKQAAAEREALAKSLADLTKEKEDLSSKFRGERVKQMFNESAFIKDKCNLPPSLMCDLFGKKADVDETGAFIGLDTDGEKMLGIDGKPANFEAWISRLVDVHPNGKTHFLRGSPNGGAGGGGGAGGNVTANPWLATNFNVTQQNILAKENPALAATYMKAAGFIPA